MPRTASQPQPTHVHIALPIASRSLYDATRSHISATSATFFPIRASPSPALVVFFGVIIEPLSAKVESDKELIRIRATLKDVEDVDVEDEGMPQIPHAETGCRLLSPRQDSDPLSNVDPVQAFEKLDLNPSSLEKTVSESPHKEDYSHLRKGHIGSVIPARPMEALVGLSRIVLHPSDIDKKALKVVFSRQKDAVHAGGMATMLKLNTWKPLACTACGFLVGEALNVESADEEPASLKFFRHAVNLAVQGSEVLYQRPFPLCFVDEIIERRNRMRPEGSSLKRPGAN
ncbi:hypothetical protein BC829DRAFT_438985 [Chytridium lagenaria]|nr:hypothetical protein BC829DRAFT_438985 [Chytridium lagenaria]